VDNSPVRHLLLKFTASGLAGRTVASAKVRLFCRDSSGAGGDFHRVLDPASWNEGSVNWNNAPAFDVATVASLGSVSAGSWYEVDVTPLLTGDGAVSLRATSTSSNGADYSSRQDAAGFAPQLVVTIR